MDKLLPRERFMVTCNWQVDRAVYQCYRPEYPVIGQKGTIRNNFRIGGSYELNNEYTVDWDEPLSCGDGDLIRHWMVKRISLRIGDRARQIKNHDGNYSPYCVITEMMETNGKIRVGHRHDGAIETRWLEDLWENLENSFELIDNFNFFMIGNTIKSKLNGEQGIITKVIDNNVYAKWDKDKFFEFYLHKEDIEVVGVKNET